MNIKKSNLKEKLKPIPTVNSASKKPPSETTKFPKHQSEKGKLRKEESDYFKSKLKSIEKNDKEKMKKQPTELLDSKKNEIIYYDPSYTPRDNLHQGKVSQTVIDPINYQNFKRSISPKVASKSDLIGKNEKDLQPEINPADPRNFNFNTLKVTKKPPQNIPKLNPVPLQQKNEDYNSVSSRNIKNKPIFSPGNYLTNPIEMINYKNDRSPESNFLFRSKDDSVQENEKDHRTFKSRSEIEENQRLSQINNLYRNSIMNNMLFSQQILNYKKPVNDSQIPIDADISLANINATTNLKALKRRISSAFEKNGKDGKLLVSNVTYGPTKVENQNQSNQVLGKKLSTLILSKSAEPTKRSHSNTPEDKYRTPDLSPKHNDQLTKKNNNYFGTINSKKTRFIKLTLALIHGKGLNTEDRVITRDMRAEKGGVVDFAQNQKRPAKQQYQIKNIIANKSPSGKNKKIKIYTFKDRERSAKLIQKWWRDFLESYNHLKDKLVKIQSVFRGFLVRKSLSDILYIEIFGRNLTDKLFVPITKCTRRYVFANIAYEYVGENAKNRIVMEKIKKIQRNVKRYLFNKHSFPLKNALLSNNRKNNNNNLNNYFTLWKNNDFEIKKAEIMQRGKNKTREFLLKKLVLNPKGKEYLYKRKAYQIWKKHYEYYILYIHFMKWFKPEVHVKHYLVSNYNNQNKKSINQAIGNLTEVFKKKLCLKPIVKAFKSKSDKDDLKRAFIKSVMFQSNLMKKNLKRYFIRWRRSCIMRKTLIIRQDKSQFIFSKLLGKIIDLLSKFIIKRFIARRFNLWKNKGIHSEGDIKIKRLYVATKLYIKKNLLYFLQKRFYEKLNKYRSKRYKDKCLKQVFLRKSNKLKRFMRRRFNLWKNIVSPHNHKYKSLKQNIIRNQIINKIKLLNSYFYRWKNHFNNKNNNSLKRPNNEDPHNNMIKTAKRNAFHNTKDDKVKISINKYSTKKQLEKHLIYWWKVTKKDEELKLKNKCQKMNLNNLKKIITKRGNLLEKYFKLWIKSLIPLNYKENLRKKIKNACEKLNKGIYKKNIEKNDEFFDKLNENVSPQYLERQFFNKLLPQCTKLTEKVEINRLMRAFKKWKKIFEKNEVMKLQFRFLHNLKNHKVMNLLRKKFIQWKCNKPINSKIYPNTIRGFNILSQTLQKNQAPYIFEQLSNNSIEKKRNLLLRSLLQKREPKSMNIKESFLKWWKCQVIYEKDYLVKTCKEIKLRNLKKLILFNKSLHKYFQRWIINIIEIKKDNTIKIKEALSKLKNALKNNINKQVFPVIQNHISPSYLVKTFTKSIFPMCKNLHERENSSSLRYYYNRWKKKVIQDKEKSMKLKLLSNMKAYDQIGVLRKAFNIWRYNNLLLKNRMYLKTIPNAIKANEILKNVMRRNVAPYLLDQLESNRDHENKMDSLKNQLKHKLKSQKFLLRSYFLKWWKEKLKINQNNYNDVQNKIKNLYMKNLKKSIMKLNKLSLENYFRKWLRRILIINQDNKSLNLFKLFNKIKKIYTIKNGKDFIDSIRNFNSPIYLKKAIVKKLIPTCKSLNEKFNSGNIRRYFQMWRKINHNFNLKNTQFKLLYKLKALNLKDTLRKKLLLWKKINSRLNKNIKSNLPILVELLKRTANKKPFEKLREFYTDKKISEMRDNIFSKKLNRDGKLYNNFLRKCFLKWKDLMKEFLVNEFKGHIMKGKLKNFAKNRNVPKLIKAFQAWAREEPYIGEDDSNKQEKVAKIRERRKKNNMMPYIIGEQIIRKLLQRKALELLKKRTELLNLKVPEDFSLKQALLKGSKGISKNISVKILFLRHFYNRWKKYLKNIEIQELKNDVVNKIFGRCNFMYLLPLKNCFNKWKNKIIDINKNNLQNDFKANIYKILYGKYGKKYLKEKFVFWREKISNYKRKLEKIAKATTKINKKYKRDNYNNLRKRIENKKIYEIKKGICSRVLKRLIMATHQGKLLYFYCLWKKYTRMCRENQYKYFILKSMIFRKNRNYNLNDKNRMKEFLLKWKINSTPKHILEKISNNRKGIDALKRNLRKVYCKPPFNKLKEKLMTNQVLQSFRKQIKNQFFKLKDDTIRKKFDHLRKMVIDRKLMHQRLRNWFETMIGIKRNELNSKPAQELIEVMKEIYKNKNEKAIIIQKQFRSLKKKKREEKLLKGLEKSNKRNQFFLRGYFNKLKIKGQQSETLEKAKLLQNYFRSILNHVKKESSTDKISSLLKNHFKKQIGDLIKKCSNNERCQRICDIINKRLKRDPFKKIKKESALKKLGKLRNRFISKFFKKRNVIFLIYFFEKFRKNTVSQTVTKCKTLQRSYKSKYVKKKQEIIVKKDKVAKQLFKNFFSKHSDKLLLKFLKWKRVYKIWLFNQKAKEIQHAFRYIKFRKVLHDVTQFNKFRNLFKRFFRKLITDMLIELNDYKRITCSNFNKMEGVLEKRIAFNNSLILANDKIRNTFFLKTLENCSDKKINIQKYYLRWKDVVNFLNCKANRLQTKYRGYLARKKFEKLVFVRQMLLKFVSNYENSKFLKKAYFFTYYRNVVKNIVIKENVRKIENFLMIGIIHEKIKNIRYNYYDLASKRLAYIVRNSTKIKILKDKLLKKLREEIFRTLETKKFFDVAVKKLKLNLFKRDGTITKEVVKRYLYKWKELSMLMKQRETEAVKRILRAYFKYKFRKTVLVKARKIQKPQRIINLLIPKNQNQIRLAFIQWKNISLKDNLNDSAIILTRYMRKIYNKINDYRRASNFINNYGAIHIISNVYNKYRMREAFLDIKEYRKNRAFGYYLKGLVDLNNSVKKEAFKKIKNVRNYNKNLYLEKIKVIQKHFKKYSVRKNVLTIFELIKRLRYILSLMSNKNTRRLNKVFRYWKSIYHVQTLNDSTKIIQNFIHNNIVSRIRRRRVKKLDDLKNLLHNNYDRIIVFNGLNHASKSYNIFKAILHLKRYIFTKLNKKINHYEALKYINKLFRLPVRMQTRLLKRYVDLWKTKALQLAEKRASDMIKKNIRIYKKNKKLSKVGNVLKSTYLKCHEMRSKYFSKWKRISCYLNIVTAQNTISKYFRNKLDSLKSTRKWIYLGKKLKPLVNKNEKINCLEKFKKYSLTFKFIEIFNRILKRKAFENIKGKDARIRIIRGLKSEVDKYEHKKNFNNINKYWKRWMVKIKQMKYREKTLEDFVRMLDTIRKINAANFLNKSFTLKKFIAFKRAVEKRFYYDKLIHYGEKQSNGSKLRNKIKLISVSMIQKSKDILTNHIYKIYCYKILQKLQTNLDKLKVLYLKTIFDDFAKGLQEKMIQCTKYRDTKELKGFVKTKLFKSKFSNKTVGKLKKLNVEKDNKRSAQEVFMYVTPYFINYLRKLVLQRRKGTFEQIKDNYKIKRFVSHLSKAGNNKLEVKKITAFNRIFNKKSQDLLKLHFMKHLKIIFRRFLIFLFTKELKPVSSLTRLNNLIKMTLIHKEICDDRFNSECISRWKVFAHMNRIAKQKIESLCKSIKTSYQNVAQEIFGDSGNNPGMIKEFGKFGEKSLIVSSQKMKEKYINKIGRKYSDIPITDEILEEEKYQNTCSPKLLPRKLVLDNIDEKLKDSLDFEVLHTEPMFSNKSIFSDFSFKTIDSGNTENIESISTKKEPKISSSKKMSEKKKINVPSSVTNRKSSIVKTKDNKKFETISYSTKQPSGQKKTEPIVKKK